MVSMDGIILNFFLKDRTTNKNIICATDSCCQLGDQFSAKMPILPELVYAIKRRTEKTKDEQNDRTRKRADVFTPSWLCCEMTNNLDEDWFGLKDCVPFSKGEVQLDLFSKALGEREPILCKIKDWKNDEVITFHSIKVNRG